MSLNAQDLPPSDIQDSKFPTNNASKEGADYGSSSMQSAYSPSEGASWQKQPGQGLQGCTSLGLSQSYEPPNQIITEIRPNELSLVESQTEDDDIEHFSDG